MDIEKAREIMNSHGVIGVHYGEAPVWLEQVHEDTGTVEIKNLATEEHLEVPAKALFEDDLA